MHKMFPSLYINAHSKIFTTAPRLTGPAGGLHPAEGPPGPESRKAGGTHGDRHTATVGGSAAHSLPTSQVGSETLITKGIAQSSD